MSMDTDRQYVRRRPGLSWHIVRTHTRMFSGWRTLCGRSIVMDDAAALDTLPGAKSCETCLRIFVRGADPRPAIVLRTDLTIDSDPAHDFDGPDPFAKFVEDDPTTSPVDPTTDTP